MTKNGAFLKRLLATFRVEAAEHITAISSNLVALEKSPSAERQAEIIETVFRESHSMKGAARAVNLGAVESICQSFESVLAALKRREIMPGPELLDLLHRSVDALEELLASVSEEGVLPEKAATGDLLRGLDDAAKGILPEKRVKAPEEPHSEPPSLSPREAPFSEEATPRILRAAAETVRISKQRLDSILLQAESLLLSKQSTRQRIIELRGIMNDVAALQKEWEDIRPHVRRTGVSAKTSGADGGKAGAGKLADLLETRGEKISRLHDSLASVVKAAEQDSRSLASMADSLLEELKTVSMLPFSSLLDLMPKVVRDLTRDRGKEAVLMTRGGEIEIDRRILDEMREPLIHMVRNCVDHGIERPEERAERKKAPSGTIEIAVSHRDGKSVEIVVSDDGSGIDISKIKNSGVRLGIFSREEADEMDEQRLLPLIFRSGVTTSPIITDISGRGLGLAIVQERVERLGGAVSCETAEEKGAAFRIQLPLTLAAFRGMLVQAEDRSFLIPLAGLHRTMSVKRNEIRTVENRETILVEGQTVPLVPLRAVLELPRRQKGLEGDVIQAAVLGQVGQRIAFTVDEILHEEEVLVKDLGKQLSRVRNLAGAAVLGTGEVVPVLNITDLLKSAARVSPAAEMPPVPEESLSARKSVLVVEDSITARALLKNILEAAGYDVRTAVDGIDAFTMLKTAECDIVVSDIEMPRMNGLDLTAKIRADKKLADLPVVLVTALESREDRERGIDVGANAYIVKSSFDQSNLLEVIGRLT